MTPSPTYPPNAVQVAHISAIGADWVISFFTERDEGCEVSYIDLVKLGGFWFEAADVLTQPVIDALNAELARLDAEQARADAEDDAIARAIDRSGPDYRTYEEWMRDKVAGERWQRLHGDQ